MTSAILVSGIFGFGLYVLIAGFVPARQPLARALGSLNRVRVSASASTVDSETFTVRTFGRRIAKTSFGEGVLRSAQSNLRILGIRPEEYLAKMATYSLGLLIVPLTFGAFVELLGIGFGLTMPVASGIFGAPLGFLMVVSGTRSRARERREAFRHALGAFLDVVAVSLASGKGIESALQTAAEIGHGWAFAEIRRALLGARLAGETPWIALGRLGDEIGVSELNELAASTALAGDEGAKVKQSLVAKAKSVRVRGMAELESAAAAQTEQMVMPMTVLMMGFLVFIGYPAVTLVMTSL